MTITLTVSEMRQALQQAAGRLPSGEGSPSTALLGTIFHRVIGELLREDSRFNLESVLQDLEPDLEEWKKGVTEHTWDQILGPLLTNQAASLRNLGSQVMDLWTAVQSAVQWLAELWWQITDQGTNAVRQSDWFWVERQVVLDLKQPHWTEPVVLLGQTDAVLRIPGEDRWCVLEWKLGQTSPVVDLAQACLYHLMLTGLNPAKNNSALAVVSFLPHRHESLFQSAQLAGAQAKLMDLIGRRAGVIGNSRLQTASPAHVPMNLSIANETAVAVAEEPCITSFVPPMAASSAKLSQPIMPSTLAKPLSSAAMSAKGFESCTLSGPSAEWLAEMRDRMLRALRKFGATCREIKSPIVGPTFVRFFLFPESGIRKNKVLTAAPDLQLHLSLSDEPVMQTVEGAIAVDLPNPNRTTFPFSQLLPELPPLDRLAGCSKVPVGMDLNGRLIWCDLASLSPHLLVVGTPGSGKSQWLRSALASLMLTNTPETLQLLLIDPKQNAFSFATGSAFLRQPIIVPGRDGDTSEILSQLVELMEERNSMLAQSRSQSLAEHVGKTGIPVQRIVVICDEYADLLDGSDKNEKKAIEHQFKRIAQMGRAAGLHLILATQQPRANVLTSSIRSLIDCRVVLRVSDARESRIALEAAGAERLLGRGDLLFKSIGTVRLQGAWLPEQEESLVTRESPASHVS